MELVGLAAILAVAGLVITVSIRKAQAGAAARAQALADSGFRACDAEAERLQSIARALRDDKDIAVRKPWKSSTANGSIYWYEVRDESSSDRHAHAADEFLCSMQRPSRQPFVLFLAPPGLGNGLGAKLIQSVVAVAAPAGLQKIPVERNDRTAPILAVFGPRGAALRDLLEDDRLAQLAQGAGHGVFAIRARDEHCAVELHGANACRGMGDASWEDSLAFVRKIAV